MAKPPRYRFTPLTNCVSCRFFAQFESAHDKPMDHGECRRRAPMPRVDNVGEDGVNSTLVTNAGWPIVMCDDWCGEAER